MGHIISVHSFRGGTGKSNITANLAYLLASRGRRVAVLDTDLQSPGVHFVFGFHKVRITHTLTHFVLGKCEVTEAAKRPERGICSPSENLTLDGFRAAGQF